MKLYSYLRQQSNQAVKPVVPIAFEPASLKLSLEESRQLKEKWKQAAKEVHRIVYKFRYRQGHAAKLNAKQRDWRKKNSGKVKEYHHVRRARKVKALGRFSGKEWSDLCEKYQHYCIACFRINVPLVPDHIVPLSCGGSNHVSNIQPLCGSCNSRKLKKTIDYRKDFFVRLAVKLKKSENLE